MKLPLRISNKPAQEQTTVKAGTISPKRAALFSLIIPGAGQLYNGEFGRGFAILAGAIIGLFPYILPGILVWGFGVYDAYQRVTRMNSGELTSKTDIAGPVTILLVLAIGIAPFSFSAVASWNKTPARSPDESLVPVSSQTPVPETTPPAMEPILPYSGTPVAETPAPAPSQYIVLPQGEFAELLNAQYQFQYSSTSVPVTVNHPPLLISFTVNPRMFTSQKVAYTKLGEEQAVSSSYVSPTSWFELTLTDKSTGTLVFQDGFGKTFGSTTKKEMPFYRPGDYNLTLRGNDITVDIRLMEKRAP
jgi:TM2 domain-containing membrane protein YozV